MLTIRKKSGNSLGRAATSAHNFASASKYPAMRTYEHNWRELAEHIVDQKRSSNRLGATSASERSLRLAIWPSAGFCSRKRARQRPTIPPAAYTR
jgi:hypothetical protein